MFECRKDVNIAVSNTTVASSLEADMPVKGYHKCWKDNHRYKESSSDEIICNRRNTSFDRLKEKIHGNSRIKE